MFVVQRKRVSNVIVLVFSVCAEFEHIVSLVSKLVLCHVPVDLGLVAFTIQHNKKR